MRNHHNVVVRFFGRLLYGLAVVAGTLLALCVLVWLVDAFGHTHMVDQARSAWAWLTDGDWKHNLAKAVGSVAGVLFLGWFVTDALFPASPAKGRVFIDRNGDGRIDHKDGPQPW